MSKLNNTQLPDTLSSKTIDNTNAINTDLTQLSISGGTGGQVLSTNGSGVLNWITASGGSSFPTTETISNGTLDITKNISYVTGSNVTLPSSTAIGQYKTIVKLSENAILQHISSNSINYSLWDSSTNTLICVGAFSTTNYPYVTSGVNKIFRYNPSTQTVSSIGGGVITGNEIYRAKFDSLGRLWVIGDFTNIGGTTCSNIAYWNGTTWTAGNVGTINGQVRQIIFDTVNVGNYWICGGFTTANGVTVNRFAYFNGTTYVGYGTGLADNFAWEMMQNNTTNDIYISGNFNSVNGIANTSGIVRFNPTSNTFSSVSGTNTISVGGFGATGGFGIYVENNKVYIAGANYTISNIPGVTTNVPFFDGTTWKSMGNANIGGTGRGIGKVDGYIVISGQFSTINPNLYWTTGSGTSITCQYFARFDEVNNRLQPYYAGTDFQTWTFTEDTNGNLWVSTQGLVCIKKSANLTINSQGFIYTLPFAQSIIRQNNTKAMQVFSQDASIYLVSDNAGNWSVSDTASFKYLSSMENYA